uniref:C-type lectin domain-containing protein n=1 Tax=Cyclopterus lumpus TaxID=8103 RepID=A0A8C2Z649_CYCLU
MEPVMIQTGTAVHHSGEWPRAASGGSSYNVDYILVTDLKKSWEEARSFCRTTYDDLATITDEDDNSAINSLDQDRDRDQDRFFWIGLHDDVDSWKWSLEDEVFYTGRDRGYRRWQGGQPDHSKGVERCVAMTNEGYWEDHSCTLQKPLICYDENSKSMYVLLAEGKSWLDAQRLCRQHHTDLASVTALNDIRAIEKVLRDNAAVQEFWIG